MVAAPAAHDLRWWGVLLSVPSVCPVDGGIARSHKTRNHAGHRELTMGQEHGEMPVLLLVHSGESWIKRASGAVALAEQHRTAAGGAHFPGTGGLALLVPLRDDHGPGQGRPLGFREHSHQTTVGHLQHVREGR